MESSDLNSFDSADREIESRLREPPPPLPSAEFTQRVLAALPSRSTAVQVSSRARRILILLGAIAGVVLAAAQIESGSAMRADWSTIAPYLEQTTAAFADPRVLTALIVAGVSALFALLPAVRER